MKGLLSFARLAFPKDLKNKDRSLAFKRYSTLKMKPTGWYVLGSKVLKYGLLLIKWTIMQDIGYLKP